ncbi:MAG: asparagine synthase (glutamine-hydrolyzing), partial [Anaerolineaceae bacterium]|nr:asparagine synthase (glutamine-hydrolyzing) [Anaerolineaceae bacterium]
CQWVKLSNGIETDDSVFDLIAVGNNIFAGTLDNGVYRSTNLGMNWTQTSLNNKVTRALAINGNFVFSSEIKAMLAIENFTPEINEVVLKEIFTYWGPLSPRSIFKNVHELPPASFLLFQDGSVNIEAYWKLDFPEQKVEKTENEYIDAFEELLINASQIRLRADVPVGAYLSGGLDSSTIAAVIQQFSDAPLETFSIQFSNPQYDEKEFQNQMVNSLRVNHHSFTCTPEDIGTIFPDVIWHTETPILRTSPAPMYLLSQLVHKNHYKVVLTGEGADEILGGYDIFKENFIRRFIARDQDSKLRPKLIQALYPEIPQLSQNASFLQAFFMKDIQQTNSPYYSHHLRWSNTARSLRFFRDSNFSDAITSNDYPVSVPVEFHSWNSLAQAQYLEMTTFLAPYLLSSQGDRMAMANSVEGRYPFLDYRIVEFANKLPPNYKLRGLNEKWILRQFAKKLLPKEIWQRRKKPYRAPIHQSFFSPTTSAYTNDLLSTESIKNGNFFSPMAVSKLVSKASRTDQLSEIEEMALVGMISTQLVHLQFTQRTHSIPALNPNVQLKVINRTLAGPNS